MMYTKVLLVHGWGGSDYPHWQSYLAGELAKEYGCVNFLRLSDFENPKLDVWKQELLEALDDFQPDIVVCHSLANTLWFHLCHDTLDVEIKKLFLVAPPSLTCDVEELSEFFPLSLAQNLHAQQTLLVTSTNDPYMSLEEAKQLQQALDVEMKVIENGGHLNAQSGYGKWEWIVQSVKSSYNTQKKQRE